MFAYSLQIAVLGAALVGAPDAERVLELLHRDLANARQSTPDAPVTCPGNINDLIGISRDNLERRLGPGDLMDRGANAHGVDVSVHQYLFADSSTGWLGLAPAAGIGTAVSFPERPFTVLHLEYGSDGLVESVSCHVASGA